MGGRLTDLQRDQFLSAYRKTFRVADHGRALKSLYSDFSNRYGVEVSVLQGLARRDLVTFPKKYAKLRHAMAALQAEAAGKSKAKKAPSDKSPSGVGRPLCDICGERVSTNHNGTIKLHNAPTLTGVAACPGTGLKVAAPMSDDKRPDDRADPTSIRTVSSGLGGLGKR